MKTPETSHSAEPVVEVDPQDALAAKILGTLLTGFFFYTIVTSLAVYWWTWSSIQNSVFQ